MGHNEKAMFAHDLNSHNWTNLYRLNSTRDKVNHLVHVLKSLMDKHFPHKVITIYRRDKPWLTDRYKCLIKLRHQARSRGDTVAYKRLRNLINRLTPNLEANFYKSKIKNLQQNESKNWWKNMKVLLGIGKEESSPLQPLADELYEGDLRPLADDINSFFQSVTSHLKPFDHHDTPFTNEYVVPDEYCVTSDDMQRHLSKLKVNKSKGPDDIPAWIYKDFCDILSGPMASIVNCSMREGFVPTLWKTANITPLPKVSPIANIESDIRPISLTPIGAKVMEYFPCKHIYQHVSKQIDPFQYGGLRGSSTDMALVHMLDYMYRETDKLGTVVRVLLCDFSKAFDLVNHSKLIGKQHNLDLPDFLTK